MVPYPASSRCSLIVPTVLHPARAREATMATIPEDVCDMRCSLRIKCNTEAQSVSVSRYGTLYGPRSPTRHTVVTAFCSTPFDPRALQMRLESARDNTVVNGSRALTVRDAGVCH